MALVNTNFILGRMNKSVDERLLPPGEYVDAMNVRPGSTETTEVGAVENTRGNLPLTTLRFGNQNLSTQATCIGAYADDANETMYWFVHDPANAVAPGGIVDMIVSFNTETGSLRYHVVTAAGNAANPSTLSFDPLFLINAVNKIEDLLFFTDDKNPPRKINVKRAYTLASNAGVDGIVDEDLNVIVKIPGFETGSSTYTPLPAPSLELLQVAGGENYLKDRFLSFAYRYRYLDNEYSATSLFTNPAFQPGDFKFDTKNFNNAGMVNSYNAVRIDFGTGSSRVKQIDLLYKDSNTNSIFVIERFKKSDYGWADDTVQSFTFTNSKIYSQLGADELLRLYDNVPKIAKGQTIMGNRLMFGNYTDGYDITNANGQDISIDFSTELLANRVDFLELPIGVPSNGTTYSVDPVGGGVTATNALMTFNLSNIATKLKAGSTLTLDLNLKHQGLSGTTTQQCYIDNVNFENANFSLSVEITLDQDYTSVYDLSISTLFKDAIGSQNFQTIAQASTGRSFTDQFNATVVAPAINCTFTKENSGITSSSTQQGFSITSSPGSNNIGIQTIAIQYRSNTGPTNMYEYFRIVSGTAFFTSTFDTSSLHSNRDYETGIVYMDEYGRASTVQVSEFNTIYIPPENSVTQNKILATINSLPPSWATKYKFVVKPNKGDYNIVYTNFFYTRPSDNMVFFKLEGENQNKVETGTKLFVKTDVTGPLGTVVEAEVLNVSGQSRDFLATDNELGASSNQLAGLYMEIKPSGFSATIQDDSLVDNGVKKYASARNSICRHKLGYPLFTFTEPSTGTYVTTNYSIPAGSVIDIRIKQKRNRRSSSCEGYHFEWNQIFTASADYTDFRAWWVGDNVNPGNASPGQLEGDQQIFYNTTVGTPNGNFNGDNTDYGGPGGIAASAFCNGFATETFQFLQATPGDVNSPLYLALVSGVPGCNAKLNNRISIEIIVTRANSLVVFETEPAEVSAEFYYDSSEALPITNGFHIAGSADESQNQTASQPAVVPLPFMDCFTFGNGVESFKIEDNIATKSVVIGQRVLGVSAEDFAEADRFADITYSGVYSSNSGVNNLNEFNLGLQNFKECETSFGPIQVLHGRETDILTLQEDKISYVLASKNLISDAAGGGALTTSTPVLGTQIARTEEYGISFNPESFAHYADSYYFTDVKRTSVIQLKGNSVNDQLIVISEDGMRSWFRDEFQLGLDTQKLGGYDPYMDEYVLGMNCIQVPTPPVILACGSVVHQDATTTAKTYTIDFGTIVDTSTKIEYVIASGTVNINVNWNGTNTTSGNVTGSGFFSFNKSQASPTTAVITVTPVGGAAEFDITPTCPTQDPITIVKCVINSVQDSGKFIHVEHQWNDSTIVSPIDSVSAELGNSNLLFSTFNSQTGFRSNGVFPYEGVTVTMRINKIGFDDYDWSFPDDNMRFLSTNTAYANNLSDVQTLLNLSSTIPNAQVQQPSSNLYKASVNSTTTPALNLPTSNSFLYLIWDLRDIGAQKLCYDASSASDACCTCTWPCVGFAAGDVAATHAEACQQPLSNTYYHNGVNALPVVNDLVYSNSTCEGNNSGAASPLPIGFYKISNTMYMQVNSEGVVIAVSACFT